MNEVENYMEVNGFQLSAEKTVLLVFTRQTHSRKDYTIRINNTEVKFLGVTINQNLCWTPHIRRLVTKAQRSVNLIVSSWSVMDHAAQQPDHADRSACPVRSRLSYGCEAHFTISDGQWT